MRKPMLCPIYRGEARDSEKSSKVVDFVNGKENFSVKLYIVVVWLLRSIQFVVSKNTEDNLWWNRKKCQI